MQWAMKLDAVTPYPLRVLFRGVGQVFFCGNAVTGLIFLLAIYLGDFTAGLAATVGVVTGTLTARLLGFDADDIDAGVYGFNGALVGPCLFLVVENTPQLWLYVVLASCLSSVVLAALLRILTRYRIPPSTAPFALTCWMFIAALYSFDHFSRSPVLPTAQIPAAIASAHVADEAMLAEPEKWYLALSRGVSGVMLANNVLVGSLLLVGIAIASWRGAFMALCGALVGFVVPILLGARETPIELGLYAFNPVLTMMAIGWVFLKPTHGTVVLALLAGILTVICQAALATFLRPIGLPTLTFPYVLVMWVFLCAAGTSKYWAADQS
ncbi:urea transporter [Marinobacter sp. X15-166B]|uniref:urea transporter n=1 Tax=Marinobacter sp. X15-166B TaxID=1897620 RepID=UPI00085C6607|nr:urea transporter [Marinobacter sp. X15-166B]OEY66088.1 urea transporter [Marinobacter sp. X15-166B]